MSKINIYYHLLMVISFSVFIHSLPNYGIATLNYSIEEEGISEAFVANIAQDSNLIPNLTSSDIAEFDFSFASYGETSTSVFLINSRTGIMRTARRIDRESICPHKKVCLVKADISVYIRKITSDQRELFVIVPVNINIEDTNDHAPRFPRDEMELSLPESVAVNYTLLISGAIDDDSTSNGVKGYKLIPENPYFRIREVRNLDGTTDIGIVVRQPLDYETQQNYSLHIVVIDGGTPPKSATVHVTINIADINDVKPTFDKSSYSVSIPENLPIGSRVIQLLATDTDSGDNGKLSYQFSPRVSRTVRSVLAVNETTGDVYIIGQLDYEQKSDYSFLVEVRDNGLHSLTSRTLVEVQVTDINDHTPFINLKIPDNLQRITISEIAAPNSFVAEMTVVDLDAGDNGKVVCTSINDNFKLINYYNNLYKIVLNTMLDYERASRQSVTIICSDNGQPSLTSNVTFIVEIEDENDNWPVFTDKTIQIQIKENNAIGDTIVQLSAVDADSEDNGRVTYSIEQEWRSMFSVNPSTGLVIASRVLDHEELSDIKFQATATDGGKNRLSSNVIISLHILDENDNRPLFDRSEYIFHVSEASSNGVIVGRLLISDADSGQNGEVNILLKDESDRFHEYFFMDYKSGEIALYKPIDKENISEINLTVLVSDNGTPVLTNSAQVSILIDDENDNEPVIVFPSDTNSSVSVTHNGETTEYVTRVIAFDRDQGDNAKLRYGIEEDVSGLFEIEVESGIIWAKKPIHSDDLGTHHLQISVSDHGLPSFTTYAYLDIVLTMDNDTFTSSLLSEAKSEEKSEENHINLIIVIVIVSTTVVFSFAILFTIFVIRKVDKSRMEKPKLTLTLTDSADKFDFSMGIETQSSKQMPNDVFVGGDEGARKKMVTFAFSSDEREHTGILQDDVRAFEYQQKVLDQKPGFSQQIGDSDSIISGNSTNDSGRGNSEHGTEDDSTLSPRSTVNTSMSSSTGDLTFVRYDHRRGFNNSFRSSGRANWKHHRGDNRVGDSDEVCQDSRFKIRTIPSKTRNDMVPGVHQAYVLQNEYLTKELYSYDEMQSHA